MADDTLTDRAAVRVVADWPEAGRQVARAAYYDPRNPRRVMAAVQVYDRPFAVFIDNSPDDRPAVRLARHALFREWAKANGIAVLAEETFPRRGPDAGFAVAVILDIDPTTPAGFGKFGRCQKRYIALLDSAEAERRAAGDAPVSPTTYPLEPGAA